MLDRNTWNHLVLCEQIFDMKLFVDNNTWNHLIVCKQMIIIKHNYV